MAALALPRGDLVAEFDSVVDTLDAVGFHDRQIDVGEGIVHEDYSVKGHSAVEVGKLQTAFRSGCEVELNLQRDYLLRVQDGVVFHPFGDELMPLVFLPIGVAWGQPGADHSVFVGSKIDGDKIRAIHTETRQDSGGTIHVFYVFAHTCLHSL